MTEPDAQVADTADRHFQEGCNCAQAVLWAVAEAHGLGCPRCIPAVALAMGGGVGHSGGMCGAMTGGVMAIGLAVDQTSLGCQVEKKRQAYPPAGRFVREFAARFGSVDCRGILGFDWSEPDAMARYHRMDAKQTRCTPCVRWAAEEASRIVATMMGAA